jgi:tight adherence protein B
MIVLWGAAVFGAVFILVRMAWPGQRVSKARLGIERKPVNPGASMDAFLERHGKRQGLAQALNLAEISTDPGSFALRVLLASIVLGIGGLVITPLLGLVGLLLPFFAVRAWVAHKGRKRQERFAEQLSDVIQLLIASMRSGFGLMQALGVLVDECEEPFRGEIERVLAEVRAGRDLSDSLRSLAVRMDNTDLDWVVGAIDINRETGGNLSEILEHVNETIRSRARITRKIRTYTAEARLSAKILLAVPILLALVEWHSNPDGFANLFRSWGLVALCTAFVLIALGLVWMRKISTIKI